MGWDDIAPDLSPCAHRWRIHNVKMKKINSRSPVHWCPSRCWWVWLFRTIRTSCAAGRPWTASRGECTTGAGPAGPPCRRPATTICGTRTGTVCCPPVRCPWAPSTSGSGPISGSTRATWETSSCEHARKTGVKKSDSIGTTIIILLYNETNIARASTTRMMIR